MNEIAITALSVSFGVCMVLYMGYAIYKDMKSKEQLFEIQMTAAKSKSIKDGLTPTEMYKIVNDMIGFYVAKTVVVSDFEGKNDAELSILLDNIIISISTEVELHLSSTFKRSWEVYFDPVDGSADVISHLKMYIAYNVRNNLIQIIEKLKQAQSLRLNKTRRSNNNETDNQQTVEQ